MNEHCGSARRNLTSQMSSSGKAKPALHALLTVLIGLMLSGTVSAQRAANQPLPLPKEDLVLGATCPAPMKQKIEAQQRDQIESADMPQQWTAGNGLNGTKLNTFYGHTIRWNNRGRCCQVTRALLTVNFKALQNGTANGSNAYNDTVYVVRNGLGGQNLPGGGVSGDGHIWQPRTPANFPAGTRTSKTITITNPAILASGHVSFVVQDDTAIESATLTIVGCCLNVGPKDGDR